jgi:hypothetical protein
MHNAEASAYYEKLRAHNERLNHQVSSATAEVRRLRRALEEAEYFARAVRSLPSETGSEIQSPGEESS